MYREEHAYVKIGKDMKAGKIPGLVLLWGEEDYLVHFYTDALIKKFVNEATKSLDLVTLDRDSVTVNSIIENLETVSLMSERKVVYIPDFYDAKGKLPKAFADNSGEMQQLTEYMAQIPKSGNDCGALLLITFAVQDDDRNLQAIGKSALYRAISSAGSVYEFGTLDNAQLRSFIEKRFRTAGKTCRSGIPDMIARETGYGNKNIEYGLYTLENDLKKIIAHTGQNTEITQRDVEEVITVNPENNVFAMLDAVGRNRKDEAFRLLHNLLQDGSGEFQLLAMITKQLELMLMAREMKENGMRLEDIQKALKKSDKVHEFRTKKALEAGGRFRTEDLKRILSSAYEVESNVKTGLMPGQLALEYFIAGI